MNGIEITIKDCEVSTEVLKATLAVTAVFEKLAKDQYGTDRDRVKDEVVRQVANAVAVEYLKQHKMELMNQIPFEELVNAIKVDTIMKFAQR